MPVVKKLINKYVVHSVCDECEAGELIWTGLNKVAISKPLLHTHTCNNCGVVKHIECVCYPGFITEEAW